MLTVGVAVAVPGLLATIVGQSDTADRGLAVAISMLLLFFGASVAPIAAHTLADGGIWSVCVPPALLSFE